MKYMTLSALFLLFSSITLMPVINSQENDPDGISTSAVIKSESATNTAEQVHSESRVQSNPYRSIGTWGQLPKGRTWGAVIGVFPDASGNILVMERCGRNTCLGSDVDPILKFDSEGNFISSFGGGLFAWPHGFSIDHEGNIWATDAAGSWIPDSQPWLNVDTGKGHAVMKFSPDGELLMVLGTPGVPGKDKNHFNQPSDVVVAPDGHIFVADGHQLRGNNRIVKFTPAGEYVLEWGEEGTDLGQFRDPHAIAIDSQGRVFVGDRMNNRIQIFDQEGNFLAVWTQFGRPSGIFFTPDDMMYVADSESNMIRNPGWERGIRIGNARDGWVRYFIPDPVPNPDQVGTSGAEYIAADEEGNVYAAEVGPRKLNKYIRLWPMME
ncbi:MAG: peptidyl-alpha-hydroxyglycine alpha-amidating lyase family protein [Cyclonatronaceae bacterium]